MGFGKGTYAVAIILFAGQGAAFTGPSSPFLRIHCDAPRTRGSLLPASRLGRFRGASDEGRSPGCWRPDTSEARLTFRVPAPGPRRGGPSLPCLVLAMRGGQEGEAGQAGGGGGGKSLGMAFSDAAKLALLKIMIAVSVAILEVTEALLQLGNLALRCFAAASRIFVRIVGKAALPAEKKPIVVVVGASFSGLACARALKRDFDVVLLDRQCSSLLSFFRLSCPLSCLPLLLSPRFPCHVVSCRAFRPHLHAISKSGRVVTF